MASFGQELKRERELRDISLKEISEATKISIRFLEALEQDNYDILPGGIFNRGFIRAYARFIGVDGEELVNAYVHEVSQRETRPGAAPASTPSPAPPKTATAAAGMFRPDNRPVPRTDRAAEREARGRDIPAERKPMVGLGGGPRPERPPRSGNTAVLWWGTGALLALAGAGVLGISLMGERRGEAQDDLAQLRMARASRKAGSSSSTPSLEAPATTGPGLAGAQGPAPGDPLGGTVPGPGTDSPSSGDPAASGSLAQGSASAVPQPPAAVEHTIRIQATEVTRVRLECGERLSVDQELWPGQTRTVNCPEPVVLGADNAGAIQYSIDGAATALLGAIGERVESVQVAPQPAAEPVPGKRPPAPQAAPAQAQAPAQPPSQSDDRP